MGDILNGASVRFLHVTREARALVFQPLGALQEAQVPRQNGRSVREARGAPDGAAAGLQDHHARREQGEPHELHRERAGEWQGRSPACAVSREPGRGTRGPARLPVAARARFPCRSPCLAGGGRVRSCLQMGPEDVRTAVCPLAVSRGQE